MKKISKDKQYYYYDALNIKIPNSDTYRRKLILKWNEVIYSARYFEFGTLLLFNIYTYSLFLNA